MSRVIRRQVAPSGTHVPLPADPPADDTKVLGVATVSPLATAWVDGGGGGGGAGSPVVRAFPFAYNTAGILTGHAVYTPAIGDVLLDAWIVITTAWNGTTPLADIGTFVGANGGLFAWSVPSSGAVDLTLGASDAA